jgi:putative peptidoglycan lipid II flippase
LTFTGVTSKTVVAAGVEFVRRLRPLFALPTAEQAHIWIERALASRLVTGSLASLDYARTLTESALLLISQPLGLALLSSHSGQSERAQIEAISRPILAFMLPASVFLFVFASDIITVVFHRGAFDEMAVLLTSQALRGMSLGLWAATLGWILLRILNSTYRNTVVAVILVAAYSVNIAVNLATAGIQQSSGAGTLLLGLGEGARGCMLLAGVAVALRCAGRTLFLIGLALIPTTVFAFVGWKIDESVTGTLQRLSAGGVACAASMGLAALILMPAELGTIGRKLRIRFSGVRRA